MNEGRMFFRYTYVVASAILLWMLIGCKTSVEPSPEPGILRITLKSAESDTNIIIQNDTSRFSRWDQFQVTVSQARVSRGDYYANVYCNPSAERKTSDTVNVLGRDWLDGKPITTADTAAITFSNSRYRKYVVFESYVPPGSYDQLTLAIVASEVEIFIPKHYLNPVGLPPGDAPSMNLPAAITIAERGVTEVSIELAPFKSLYRYRDQFYFSRKVVITDIKQK